jgi:hypothetical protein
MAKSSKRFLGTDVHEGSIDAGIGEEGGGEAWS